MPAKTAPTKAGKSVSATLASMVKTASEKTPEPATVAASTPAPAPFDWSTVAAPTVAVYSRNTTVSKSVETSTPEFIKNCVKGAFEKTSKNLDGKGKPSLVWLTLKLDTPERAEEFVKLAKKYAAFCDYTMRGMANPAHLYVTGENGEPTQVEGKGYVRFGVKVRETRKQAAK